MFRPLPAIAAGLVLAACERGFLPLGGRFEIGRDPMVIFVGGDAPAGGDLYALQVDGGGAIPITFTVVGEMRPSLAPDGGEVAFLRGGSLTDASGSGSRRLYAYEDLLELRIVKQLLDAGIKLEMVRQVFAELRRLVGDEIASAKLVIDGSSVALALDDGQLLDLVKQGQGVLNIMNLGQCQADLDARIVSLRDGGTIDAVATSASHHPTSIAR